MKQKLFRVLWLLMACDVSFGGHFNIIGPQTVIVGTQYRAYLTSTDYESGSELQITVHAGSSEIFAKTYDLNESTSQEITFNIAPGEKSENYTLKAAVRTDHETSQSYTQYIKILRKNFSVFMQTDKAIYKPGDNVNFRVLVLNTEMKPYQFKELKVVFTDGDKTRTGEMIYIDYDNLKMIYEGTQKLPDVLAVGKWGVHVSVDDSDDLKKTQNFQVVDYDLPEFKVYVEPTSSHMLFKAKKVTVQISAKYLVGKGNKYVKGNANVTATVYKPGDQEKQLFAMSRDINNITTTKDVTFRLQDLKIDGKSNYTDIKFEVSFNEDDTKRSASAVAFVTVYKFDQLRSEIVGETPFLPPGQPYKMKVFIRNFDYSLVTGNKKVRVNVLRLSYKSCKPDSKFDRKHLSTMERSLLEGAADFEIDVPFGTEAIIVGIYYNDLFTNFHKIWRIPTKSGENLNLVSPTISRQEISVKVVATHEMSKIFSLIIGRSGIIHHQTDEAGYNETFDMRISISPKMLLSLLPTSNLVVYYIQSGGEVIFNQMKLKYEDLLANTLDVQLESKDVLPGDYAKITLKTTANSFVGLISEDERVSIFRSANNISEAAVTNELNSLFYATHDVFNSSNRENAYSLIAESNAFILTNAVDPEPVCGVQSRTSLDVETNEDVNDISQPYSGPSVSHLLSDQIPETWLFKSFKVDGSGRHSLTEKMPYASTSYLISGFSIHPVHGLGLSKPQTLNTFKDFLPEINAPLFVKLGEVIQVKVFLYNFGQISSNERVTMTLYNDDSEFTLLKGQPDSSCKYEAHTKQDEESLSLHVSGSGKKFVTFYLKPIKAGSLKLRAKANVGIKSAETSKTITSEPTGLKKSQNKVKFFDLRKRKYDGFYFDMTLDDNIQRNSVQMKASVTGDLLGPALDNIERILDSPAGTTNQKLVDYIPTAFLLNYLKSVNQLTDQRRAEGLSRLQEGYEFVLRQKSKAPNLGAFKEWDNDELSNIETTALVTLYLSIAKQWIEIQDSNIVDALSFLKSKQQENGCYLDGEQNESIELTAFVTISFLENHHYIDQYKGTINKALYFLNSKLESILEDNYALAISAYALALVENSAATSFLDKLEKNAIVENKFENNLKFWNSKTPAHKVGTAAYAILALDKSRKHLMTREILNWLLTQRTENGGFHTSKDTIVGIQAVSKLAGYFHSDSNNINLNFLYDPDQTKQVNVSGSNSKPSERTIDIPSIDGVSVQAEGTGVAYVQVWQTYALKLPENLSEKFKITIQKLQWPNSRSNKYETLLLNFCITYKSQETAKLTVAEVGLPSGYVFDEKKFVNSAVKSSNTRRGKSIVHLFFPSIGPLPVCVEIPAKQQHLVSSMIPNSVKVYEADDPDKFTVDYYLPFKSPICEH